jgi:hypothetical protein
MSADPQKKPFQLSNILSLLGGCLVAMLMIAFYIFVTGIFIILAVKFARFVLRWLRF